MSEMNGGVVKKHYTAGGRRIALRSGGVLSWLLGDHLGGTAVTVSGTAETGEVRYGSNSSWGARPSGKGSVTIIGCAGGI